MVMAVLLQNKAKEEAEKKTPTCEQFSQIFFCQCWPNECLLCCSWATRCNSDISISTSILPLNSLTWCVGVYGHLEFSQIVACLFFFHFYFTVEAVRMALRLWYFGLYSNWCLSSNALNSVLASVCVLILSVMCNVPHKLPQRHLNLERKHHYPQKQVLIREPSATLQME